MEAAETEESKLKRGRGLQPSGSANDAAPVDFGALLQQVLAGNQRIEGTVGAIGAKVDNVALRVDRVESRQAGLESRLKSFERRNQESNASTSARSAS